MPKPAISCRVMGQSCSSSAKVGLIAVLSRGPLQPIISRGSKQAVAVNAESPGIKVPFFKGHRLKLNRRPGSPDPQDLERSREWVHSQPRPWAVDLFAGAGGLSLGLRDAGINVIAAAEEDPVAAETHAANLGGLTWVGDLRDSSSFIAYLKERDVHRVDVVAGGPPCQPFSNAGLSKIRSLPGRQADERAGLWRAFFGVIDELSPTVVLLENVPAFASAEEGAILAAFMGELEERGFQAQARVVEAWRHGVPQHRKRLFVVASRNGDPFRWPRASWRIPTVRDAIGDLPVVGPGQREERMARARYRSSRLALRLRRDLSEEEVRSVTDHVTREVRSDDAEIFALMKPGQTYADVPSNMRRYRADIFDDKYTRLSWEALSRSITAHIAKDGYWYIHPEQDRTLSIREAARIQTFPDWFRFAGHPSNRFRQIGNAVPPMLAEAIGRSIVRSLPNGEKFEGIARTARIATRSQLDRWYQENGRNYLWRRLSDPWAILLAEVCLQRTRADQVAAILPTLLTLAPTPRALLANECDVRKVAAPLGLDWRTTNLFHIASLLCERHDGEVPENWDALRRLPGVGDYIASAVFCFAFGRDATLIDTNTNRIAKRIIGNPKAGRWEVRLALQRLSRPRGPDRNWNFGLLDLGALICTSRQPHCSECPIRFRCSTGRRNSRARTRPARPTSVREALNAG